MPFTILWDNDGVLVLTEERYFEACRETLAGLGVELTRAFFVEHSLLKGQSVFDLVADRGFSAQQLAGFRAARDRRYGELIDASPCVAEGAAAALRDLYGRVQMGVVTGSLRRHFERAHARSGLSKYFDFVLAREDYAHSKPHPDSYLTALTRFNLRPDECVVVEDTGRGLQAAREAGLRCLVLPTDLTREQDFSGAYEVLHSIRDVPDAVARLMQLSKH
jgi:HAD superfamily hydrolase (TIGR01509 family)